MDIRSFLGIATGLLAIWLGAAFYVDVPSGRYPLLEKSMTGKPTNPAVVAKPVVGSVEFPPEP
jgi:hypothetical protein